MVLMFEWLLSFLNLSEKSFFSAPGNVTNMKSNRKRQQFETYNDEDDSFLLHAGISQLTQVARNPAKRMMQKQASNGFYMHHSMHDNAASNRQYNNKNDNFNRIAPNHAQLINHNSTTASFSKPISR